MRILPGVLAVVLVASFSDIARPQAPTGYTRVDAVVLPDSLQEVLGSGHFRITVLRVAADSGDRRLITIAESLIPARDTIEQLGRAVTGRGHVIAQQEAAAMPGARWWWRDWDGILLPYALTGQAVTHYIERVRSLAAGPNPFAQYNPGVQHRASVEYTARVARRDPDTGSATVHLEVRFHFFCGGLCALSFVHTRAVEFDRAGRAVRVSGDRPPTYEVS